MRPLPEYPLNQHAFSTPRGNTVTMYCRANTNDWNTCNSSLTEDEYGLRDLYFLAGTRALDVGAYIGSVAIGLAIDNPELEVTALEAVPPNVTILRQNLEINGLTDRVKVIEGAACSPKRKTQNIAFGYRGTVLAEHHAFVGNSTLLTQADTHDVTKAPCHSLSEFVPLDLLKIDCEGCEWDFLSGAALAQVASIHGEWHPTSGHVQADMLAVLEATHEVAFTGPEGGPGGFRAVRK